MSKCNNVHIVGRLASTIAYDHESHGKSLYAGFVSCIRTSNTPDILKIIFSEDSLQCFTNKDKYIVNKSQVSMPLKPGPLLDIIGEIRAYDVVGDDGKSHKQVYVYAQTVNECSDRQHENLVNFIGYLVKPIEVRTTSSDVLVGNTTIAINRPTQKNRTDYIPVIAWRGTAKWLQSCQVGDKLSMTGRFQSRTYIKDDAERTTYEVSLFKAKPCQEEDTDENCDDESESN